MINNKNIYCFTLLLCILPSSLLTTVISLSPTKWPGRLGDQIYYLSKCLMLSNKYTIAFNYKPFDYSNEFALHDILLAQLPQLSQTCKIITIEDESEIPKYQELDEQFLLIINYNTTVVQSPYAYWRYNVERFSYITSLFRPKKPITQTIKFPENHITVAVHIRKGGGYDPPLVSEQLYDYVPKWIMINKPSNDKKSAHFSIRYNGPQKITPVVFKRKRNNKNNKKKASGFRAGDKMSPKRFPPNQYYIECIKKLSKMVNHQPLYIDIFTDDLHPQALVELLKEKVNLPNIVWQQKEVKKSYKASVIEDLLAMTHFDCLIKGDSYFAWSSQFLGDHKLVFYPSSVEWNEKRLQINRIGILNCTNQLPLLEPYD